MSRLVRGVILDQVASSKSVCQVFYDIRLVRGAYDCNFFPSFFLWDGGLG